MAIKVTGTTVINDSRQLENVNNATDFVQSANFVRVPQLFIDGELQSLIDSTPTLTTSNFSVFGSGTDTHASTDWEVVRTSDSTTVFSSIGDTINLTSIDVTTVLQDEEHLIRVRHNGTSLGASEYHEVTVTVNAPFSLTTLGEPSCGGFYMGTVFAADTCYYLIVAPNSTGCASCSWGSTTLTNSNCFIDGYANTYPNPPGPAANFTATRTIGGFSDWYMPAKVELTVMYDNGAGGGSPDPLPSGEDFSSGFYNSSLEQSSSSSCGVCFLNGDCFSNLKTRICPVRAVRRVPV